MTVLQEERRVGLPLENERHKLGDEESMLLPPCLALWEGPASRENRGIDTGWAGQRRPLAQRVTTHDINGKHPPRPLGQGLHVLSKPWAGKTVTKHTQQDGHVKLNHSTSSTSPPTSTIRSHRLRWKLPACMTCNTKTVPTHPPTMHTHLQILNVQLH